MNRRVRYLPAAVAILVAILALAWIPRPAYRSGTGPCAPAEAHFTGPGEGFAFPAYAFTKHAPICLGRFWYSTKIDTPSQFFKVWVNWGNPRHQDRADRDRGFWAHVRFDPDHSTAGQWCYLIENEDASNGAPMRPTCYGLTGSYIVSMKVWDAGMTPLKPTIAAGVTAP